MCFNVGNGNYYRSQSVPSGTCEIKKKKEKRDLARNLNDEEKIRKKKRLTNILWLYVGMNKITFFMQIFQPEKNLLCNHPDDHAGNTFLLVPLNKRK